MSGGGLGGLFSGGGGMQTFDPVGSLGTNLINSVFGTNLLGQGGMSNNWATHVGNNLTGLNMFNAGNNAMDAANAANAVANPSSIGQLGTIAGAPKYNDPTLWGQRTPQGGMWNQIAQQMAGPIYQGGLQIPGVSPGTLNMPLGQSGQSQGQSGGPPMPPSAGKGAMPPMQQTPNNGFNIPNWMQRGLPGRISLP